MEFKFSLIWVGDDLRTQEASLGQVIFPTTGNFKIIPNGAGSESLYSMGL